MKVLVVDDDVVSRMVLMHLIDSCGSFEIHEAEDGEAAWAQFAGGLRPSITFCDLRMPRLGGMGLLERVKTISDLADMPFVLVSSSTDDDTVGQANDCGAAGYIVKPFQADQVRVHLAPFAGLAAGAVLVAEDPAITLARLGINAERFLVYLGGFQSQLTTAGGELDVMLARGEQDAARARIDRLRAGCVTLGLSGAADGFGTLGVPLRSDDVHGVLADAVRAVIGQSDLVKKSKVSP